MHFELFAQYLEQSIRELEITDEETIYEFMETVKKL